MGGTVYHNRDKLNSQSDQMLGFKSFMAAQRRHGMRCVVAQEEHYEAGHHQRPA
jgi:hypothetical protein